MPRESANTNAALPATPVDGDPFDRDTQDNALDSATSRFGPIVRWVSFEQLVWGRLYAAVVTIAAVGLLAVAAYVQPAEAGMGTHRSLGLPQCSFERMTALPCPTCGMTTAFAYTVRGRLFAAATAQVGGLCLALATIGVCGLGIVGMIAARRPSLNWYRVQPDKLMFLLTLAFLGAWAIKIVLVMLERTGASQ